MSRIFVTIGAEVNGTSLDQETSKKFNTEVNVVATSYTQSLPSVKIKNLGRININLTDGKTKPGVRPNMSLIPVCNIVHVFNFKNYFSLSSIERAKLILEEIRIAIEEAAEQLQWDINPFTEAYNKTDVSKGFVYKFPINIKAKSKDKQHIATIEVSQTPEASIIYIVFLKAKGDVIKRVEVIKVISNNMYVSRIIGFLEWINNEDVVLTNSKSEINFKVSLDHDKVELFLTPKEHNESYLLDDLKIISAFSDNIEVGEVFKSRLSKEVWEYLNDRNKAPEV